MRHRLLALSLFIACGPVRAETAPLAAEAGMARYALAASAGAFLDSRDPVSRAAFARALGSDRAAVGALWSQIVAGAIQLRREDGANAETLWFNPLFDAGLATRWALAPGGWRAVAAMPVTGEMLRREAPSFAPVAWRGGPLKTLMEAKARATWRAGARGGWLGLRAKDAGTTVLLRAAAAKAALDRMRTAPGYDGSIHEAWRALATDDQAGLPASVQRGLALTGLKARLTLRPVAAFERPDGWTVAMQSPDAPRLTWLAHFANPQAGGKAALRGYQLVDMGEGR